MTTTTLHRTSRLKYCLQATVLILFIFLAFTRWMPGGDPLNPESGARAWIEISLVALSLVGTIILWGPRHLFSGIRLPTFLPLVLFCVWAMITGFWSNNPILAVGKGLELLILTFVAFSIAYQSARSGVSLSTVLLISLILITLFLFLVNLVYYQTFFPMIKYGTRMRLVLGYTHPNTIATIFSSSFLFAFYLFVFKRSKSNFVILILIIIISAVLVYLTDSRTTTVASILAAGLLLIFKLKDKWVLTIIVIAVAFALIFMVFVLSSGVIDQQANNFLDNHPDYLTLNGRTLLWADAMENLEGFNLIGNGYFNTRFLFLVDQDRSWAFQTHNSFIELFFSTGFIGLTLAAFFLLFSLVTSKRAFLYPIPIVYLLYLTLESMMETKMFVPNIPMFILMTLIFSQQLPKRETNDSSRLPAS